MRIRLVPLFLALVIVLPMLTAAQIFASDPVAYDLLIAWEEVTEENASDILGDGVFSYDPEKNVLTVKGDCSIEENVIINGIEDLTVFVERDALLSSGEAAVIISLCDITITGPGELTLKGKDAAVWVQYGSTLTLEDARIEVNCPYGIVGNSTDEKLIIKNGTIHAVGEVCCFALFGSITFEDCEIFSPVSGIVKNGAIYYDGAFAKEVLIAHRFLLWVGSNRVNSYNATDILGDGLFSYNAAENVLYVNGNRDFKTDYAIENRIPNLEIRVVADSELTAGKVALRAAQDTIISGPGKLTLVGGSAGISVSTAATLTIKGDVEARGDFSGIRNARKIIIDNCNVHASTNNTSNFGAIYDFDELILNGCSITDPEEGYIGDRSVVDKNGNVAKDVTIRAHVMVLGDVDGDGNVTMKDVLLIRKIIAGALIEQPDAETIARADVDGDGKLTMKDILMLRKIVAGAV